MRGSTWRPTRPRPRPALLMVGASAALVAPFLLYVSSHVEIVATGYRIEASETALRRLEQENRALRFEQALLEAPIAVAERARKAGLVPVPPSRMVALVDRGRSRPLAPPPLPSPPAAAAPGSRAPR